MSVTCEWGGEEADGPHFALKSFSSTGRRRFRNADRRKRLNPEKKKKERPYRPCRNSVVREKRKKKQVAKSGPGCWKAAAASAGRSRVAMRSGW